MTERVVINTGPLVALARMDALEIAGLLPLEFVCPREVQAELQEGARRGHIPVAPQWLRTQVLKRPLSPATVVSLDAGEAAVIQMAIEQDIAWVCMDELKGRRAAASAGLKVVGANMTCEQHETTLRRAEEKVIARGRVKRPRGLLDMRGILSGS